MEQVSNEIWALIGNGAGVVAVILVLIFVNFIKGERESNAQERKEERELRHKAYETQIKSMLKLVNKNIDDDEIEN